MGGNMHQARDAVHGRSCLYKVIVPHLSKARVCEGGKPSFKLKQPDRSKQFGHTADTFTMNISFPDNKP